MYKTLFPDYEAITEIFPPIMSHLAWYSDAINNIVFINSKKTKDYVCFAYSVDATKGQYNPQ